MKKPCPKLCFKLMIAILLFNIIEPSFIFTSLAEVDLNPIMDTYAYEYEPTLNYGGENYIYLETDSGRTRYGYLKFNLSSVPSIDHAYLYIYIRSLSSTATLSLFHVLDNNWDEYSLTWNNRPNHNSTTITSYLAVSGYNWVVFDITSLAENQIVSLLVTSSSTDATSFYSKEYSSDTRHPYIRINPEIGSGGLNIDNPPDKSIFNGTVGNSLTWHPSALSPSKYNVTQDGVLLEGDSWDGSAISISIDGLNLGSFIFTLSVNNTDGDSVSDSITVFVVTSVEIIPVSDSYVYEYEADTNFGGQDYLEFDGQIGRRRRSYLKFEIPPSAYISEATLNIRIRSVSATTSVSIYQVPDNSWEEYTLTWNNRPSYIQPLIASCLAVSGYAWISFDLTSLIQFYSGQTVTLCIFTSNDNTYSAYSREYGNYIPYISINKPELPIIDNPSDISIYHGTSGNYITWRPESKIPDKYTLERDGVYIEGGDWDGTPISINVDNLDLGHYSYTLQVNDTNGNSISDTIAVTNIISGNNIINPIADAYVYEYQSDYNFGGLDYLEFEGESGRRRWSYLKFELPPIASVTNVSLNFRVRSVSATTTFSIYQVSDNTWEEYGITWNNRPSYMQPLVTFGLAVTGYVWLSFDLTSLIQSHTGQTLTLCIFTSNDNTYSAYAKEYGNYLPHLNITGMGTYGPEVLVASPETKTYLVNSVSLDFSVNTTTSWIGYSLDNNPNITISAPTLLNNLAEGPHSVVVYASDIFGNTAASSKIHFTIDTPPTVTLLSPYNLTYIEDQVWLNFSIDQVTDWIGYSLDGAMNITITNNLSLSSLSDDSHFIMLYANDSFGSMVTVGPRWFSIDTTPPGIAISSPLNTTYITSDLWFSLTFNESTSWTAYSLDGNPNITISGSTYLTGLSDSSHSIIVYAKDNFGNLASSTISFTIDTPPELSIVSPMSSTYSSSDLWLNFTINEPTAWIGYSLDGGANITIFSNTLLLSLPEGDHNILVYANDSYGSMVASPLIIFSIDTISPQITLFQPVNATYTSNSVFVDFEIDETVVWMGYSLDSAPNVTIIDDFWLNSLSQGSHSLVLYAIDEVGNQNSSLLIWFTIDTPPIISLSSPFNISYPTVNISLEISLNEPVTWIGYSLDGQTNVTIPLHMVNDFMLTFLEEGVHSVIIFASDSFGNTGVSEPVWFSVDTVPPTILITNPVNSTYTEPTIWLTYTIDEPTSWIGYSLNDMTNFTITDDIELTDLSEGFHYIVIYAMDLAGNVGISEVIWFTITLPDDTSTTSSTSTATSSLSTTTTSISSSRTSGFLAPITIFACVASIIKRQKRKKTIS